MRGRRGAFSSCIDVRGSLATNWVEIGAAGSCVAGVTLSTLQARFAWQAWHFQDLHRCPRKLGDELGRLGAAAFYLAGVTLSAPQARFAWQAWHFQDLHRCPRKLGDELGRIGAAAFCVAGVALSTLHAGSICVAGVARSVAA